MIVPSRPLAAGSRFTRSSPSRTPAGVRASARASPSPTRRPMSKAATPMGLAAWAGERSAKAARTGLASLTVSA